MNIRSEVAALKQHLEHLFPGKWITGNSENQRHKVIATGLPEIDHSLINGLHRQRITEWLGLISSGKTSFLRTLVSNWCSAGLHVAYVDSESRLLASDWASLGSTQDNAGRFWVIRLNNDDEQKSQDAIWSAEQLIRSHAFDVVILDLATNSASAHKQSRNYARLQRVLDKSRTALLILKDVEIPRFARNDNSLSSATWGCHSRFSFAWQRHESKHGFAGIAAILPVMNVNIFKDGMSKHLAITPYPVPYTQYKESGHHVPNCLFTHPSIPDRRTPKA